MEITETDDLSQADLSGELILTRPAQFCLNQITKWTKFLSIAGFIGSGLILLLGLAIVRLTGTFTTYQDNKPISEPFIPFSGFLYILVAVVYFLASRYLYQFGEKIRSGIIFQDPLQIESGFSKLRSLFKMIGITAIILIVVYLVVIILSILGVLLMRPQSVNYGL